MSKGWRPEMANHERKTSGERMKLHFEPDLDFQLEAIEAVCDLLRGQEICRTEFTDTADPTAPRRASPSPRTNSASGTG